MEPIRRRPKPIRRVTEDIDDTQELEIPAPVKTAPITEIPSQNNITSLFIDFICQLEGWKTRTKNLHWSARHKNIHEYLDDFLGVISDYQDGLVEGTLGIHPNYLKPTDVNGTPCNVTNAFDLIEIVKNKTCVFYDSLPEGAIYSGVRSECETFIQNINKYDCLFHLCEV